MPSSDESQNLSFHPAEPSSKSFATASPSLSSGTLNLRLQWIAWSKPTARSMAKTLTSLMIATKTLTWKGMNLKWQVQVNGPTVSLDLWQEPDDKK